MTARSALPYNITTGRDDNRDNETTTDRPQGSQAELRPWR